MWWWRAARRTAAIVDRARIGLMIMLPWTWSIAYRRFQQGVLIRFGHSRSVGAGTVLRLSSDLTVLAVGYTIGTIQGIVVATTAVAPGSWLKRSMPGGQCVLSCGISCRSRRPSRRR